MQKQDFMGRWYDDEPRQKTPMENIITVAQLIRQLQELGIEAQDLPVVRRDSDWGYVQIRRGAQIVKIEAVADDQSFGWTVDEDDPGIEAVILK